MKAFFVLLLAGPALLADKQQEEPDFTKCKREIVESYNLNGYLSPRTMNFYLCPAMKQSCCSMYDQFMMFTTWREQVRVKFDNYYSGIELKLKRIKQLLKVIFKVKVRDLIEKLQMEQDGKDKVLQKFMLLKDKNLYKLTDQVLGLFDNNRQFMMQLRSTFYCSICDFTSHRYIDLDQKIVNISQSTCADLVGGTINFSYFMNVELAQYLMDLSALLLNFAVSSSDRPVSIREYRKIRRNVGKCAIAFRNGLTDIKQCERYCEYYRINSNSPVIEGYQVFFNEITNSFEKFVLNHVPHEPNKDDSGEDDDGTNVRRLQEAGAQTGAKSAEASNEGVETLQLDAGDLEQTDPYAADGVDPDLDDYVLHKMFSFEKDYVKDRQINYVNFIKNKLHFVDVEYDYEKADENDLFKSSTRVIVDLENFGTKVLPTGVDQSKHLYTTNIDKSIKELVSHLKSRSRYRIMYEKLDPTLLEQINDLTNANVRNFHRDNFLKFKDMSLMLKQEELMNNYDNVAKAAKKKGYTIY